MTVSEQQPPTFHEWLINLNTGAYRQVATGKSDLRAFISADNKTAIIYTTRPDADQKFLSVVPIDGGQAVTIQADVEDLDLSPDQSMLAYVERNADDGHYLLNLISRDGKRVKTFDPFSGYTGRLEGSDLSLIKWVACTS